MTSFHQEPIDQFEALLGSRFSCRAFKSEPVPHESIERILAAAQRTPSWCNSQPWQVIVTGGEGTERLGRALTEAARSGSPNSADFAFPRQYRGVYDQRRKESGFQLYNALGIERGDKAAYGRQMLENFRFFGAPHVAIVTTDEALGVYGAIDCGGYVSNFMNAAQALGMAAIAQAALASQAATIHKHFDLSDERKFVCGISFGFADENHKANSFRTSRATVGEAVKFVTD
jgi:nitroreductase